jgi:hypothetical protein
MSQVEPDRKRKNSEVFLLGASIFRNPTVENLYKNTSVGTDLYSDGLPVFPAFVACSQHTANKSR